MGPISHQEATLSFSGRIDPDSGATEHHQSVCLRNIAENKFCQIKKSLYLCHVIQAIPNDRERRIIALLLNRETWTLSQKYSWNKE